ncbi:MAG: efflux RND transporter permease subunit [Synergistales bacterium]|nr:efflux RND transporter permease subunit [Synergistales bacterium]MDY6401591.1 efflux RND transporter permease subunit [Synergistales bacterium]MDY6405029.1 efflux RND transporter permease subunit [Synergistales bacterium]MDY6425405.1 efflux RND transporter permease subunit [Synergistales bacterium]MDY6429335.1 efflux RND transporter permease subunit [Synergistales bacterium]
MRGFIRFCIYHPVFTGCSVVIWILLGISSYFTLGVTLYPDVELPFVLVRTTYTGAGPNEIEQLISKPLEDALADLENLKSITTYSLEGVSMVAVEMMAGTNPDLALVDVNNKVKAKVPDLPDDADEPVASKFDISAQPFLIISFSSSLPEKTAKKMIEDRIQPVVARVKGVGRVDVTGGRDREIHINLDPAALSDYGINYMQVCNVVAANNQTTPSGYVTQRKDEVSLRLMGEFNEVEQLEDILIPTPNGQPVRLSMLGEVIDGEKDQRSMARADGKPVVQLRISPRSNADVVEAGRLIKRLMTRTMRDFPDFTYEYTYDDTSFVESAVKNIIRDTAIGIALTALVIYLFLGRFGATFIVAFSMPVAFAATFVPLQIHHYTLNLMSTLGLALSMGTLVMNAILIIQNIYRFRDMGYGAYEAAEEGTVEISMSVLAGVFTNLGVFMPVALMSTIAGQFLKPYAVTIVYATAFSLWVTMAVTPCLAARMKKKKGDTGELPLIGKILTGWWNWIFDGFRDLFFIILHVAIKFPFLTVLFTILATYGSLKLGGFIGTQFTPSTDDGTVRITLTLDNNSSIHRTSDLVYQVEDYINSIPDRKYIKNVVSTVASSMRSQSISEAQIALYMTNDPDRPSTQELADKIRPYLSNLPGVQIAISATRSGFGNPIEIQVKGEDLNVLYNFAEEIRARGRNIPGVRDLRTEMEMGKPELQVKPIRWRLAPLGINISDLAGIVRGYLIGRDAGKFRQGGYEYDIKARINREKASDIFTAHELPIMTGYGLVPLDEMSNISWGDSPTEIRRVERQRAVVVTGNVRYITSGEGNAKMRDLINHMEIPEGVTINFGGEQEDMAENFIELIRTLIIAIVITYLVVAAILESWTYSLVILATIPMAAIGVVPAMLISEVNISIFALIGMIMLVGMVVNNAIVVVDYAEVLRLKGTHPYEAVEEACHVRFKSLLMAVVTSVVSLLPLLSTGRGSEMKRPIAVVAIGGLVAGGMLAMLSIPAAYKLVWRVRLWWGRVRGREWGEKDDDEEYEDDDNEE